MGINVRFLARLLIGSTLPEGVLNDIIENNRQPYRGALSSNPSIGSYAWRLLGGKDNDEVVQTLLVVGHPEALEMVLQQPRISDDNIRVLDDYWRLSREDYHRIVEKASLSQKFELGRQHSLRDKTSYQGLSTRRPWLVRNPVDHSRSAFTALSMDAPEWYGDEAVGTPPSYDVATIVADELGDGTTDSSLQAWRYLLNLAENQPSASLADVLSTARVLATCTDVLV
jgi:hypothetical protein